MRQSIARRLLHHCRFRVRLSVGNVVVHRVVEENRLLRHLRHLAAQRSQRQIAQIVAVDQNAARGHIEESRNQIDQRGFARAARPDHGQHFAGVHLEIDVMKNLVLALVGRVGESHILKFDGLAKAREAWPHAAAPPHRP